MRTRTRLDERSSVVADLVLVVGVVLHLRHRLRLDVNLLETYPLGDIHIVQFQRIIEIRVNILLKARKRWLLQAVINQTVPEFVAGPNERVLVTIIRQRVIAQRSQPNPL